MAETFCFEITFSYILYMKLLIDINHLTKYKSRQLLPLECEHCKSQFYRPKNDVQWALKRKSANCLRFCGKMCRNLHSSNRLFFSCKECNISIERTPSSSKSKYIFCSTSCSAFYYNKHKTWGTSRSKLEKWIESKLKILYPSLVVHYNKNDTINAELDIYIPSLKLAFELNGPFHYEPIFGEEKLKSTQTNDKRKFQACLEHKIELCIIDTSKQRYFKEKTSNEYLCIITNIIEQKLLDVQSSNI